MNVALALLSWPVLALVAFKTLAPHRAVLLTVLGGWILLPVGIYPEGATSSPFPFWLVGSAVPSDMLITKAWIAPASAMLGVALTDWRRLSAFRFSPFDFPLVAWCLWPLAQELFSPVTRPDSIASSAYLFGTWGLPWLLGRLYFNHPDRHRSLLVGMAWSAIACLPFAIWEGLFGPDLYAAIYEAHPFAKDGAERYIGWRPIGFFEHGNLYGLWVSLCALSALWVWRSSTTSKDESGWKWGAILSLLIALLSQSIGAIFLLALGCAGMHVISLFRVKRLVVGALVGVIAISALYISGAAPIAHWGKETTIGRKVVEGFKATGRGSLPWRISQDQKAIALVKADAMVGKSTWDWWSSLGTRPWGMALLIVGQFGIVGFLCAFGTLTAPVMRILLITKQASQWENRGAGTVLSIVVLLALMDSVLNSFFFFPAILASAALVPLAIRGSTNQQATLPTR